MTTIVLGLIAVALLVILLITLRWWTTAFIAVVVTLTLLPRSTGIEIGVFDVKTYDAVILGVLLVGVLAFRGRPGLVLFAPFLVVLSIGAAFEWVQGEEMWRNVIYLVVGVAAWAIGDHFAKNYVPGSRQDLVIVCTLAAVVLVQVVVTVLQTAGVEIFALQGRTADLEGGRANGTFSHPGTAGKVMILFAALLLPFTQGTSPALRRVAYATLVLAIVPVGLSESRANFVGYFLTLLLWFVITLGRSMRASRVLAISAVAVGGLLFAGTIIDRFAADPEGGARQHLTDVALAAIARDPWLGVGPGNYLPIVGQTDTLTGEGWRVHNVFLLQIAELGILGALLFFLPALLMLLISLRLVRTATVRGAWARASLASAAGTLVTAVTGWGLMNGSILMLWFLCMGFSYRMIRRNDLDLITPPPAPVRAPVRARRVVRRTSLSRRAR